jgi:GntR family transcriptional regulator
MAVRPRKKPHSSLFEQGVPLYLQVASVLRSRIRDGGLKVGDRVSTIEELERELGVARVTIRQAIEVLYEEGLLRPHQGKGTFVTNTNARDRWLELSTDWPGLIAPIKDNIPHMLLVNKDGEPALRESDGNPAQAYVCLKSVQTRDGEPYAIARVHIARDLYERCEAEFQKRVALAVLADMKDAGIRKATQTLEIGSADLDTAHYLRIPLNSPTAEARCVVTGHKRRVLYLGEITYRGDCVRINIELKGAVRASRAA